jgi:pyruvate,orthophosphate dikinase
METRHVSVKGVGASAGVASGEIVFRSDDAVALTAQGRAVILVRMDTTAEDVPGIRAAAGVVTTRGGLTGDAAIIARSLGKPCIAGCAALVVDYARDQLTIRRDVASGGDVVVARGERITIDGRTGELRLG